MKPVCVTCERFMRPKLNGFYFMEGKPSEVEWDGKRGKTSEGWSPYKLWAGDFAIDLNKLSCAALQSLHEGHASRCQVLH